MDVLTAVSWLLYKLSQEVQTWSFLISVIMGTLSGVAGGALRYVDKNVGLTFLEDIVPDKIVMNGFFVFASLVASFRTSHALAQYTDAASYFLQLRAAWFDAAATLFAYCKDAPAGDEKIVQFQQTLVRLVSLMNALCLETLSASTIDNDSLHQTQSPKSRSRETRFSFEVLSPQSFHADFLDAIAASDDKPELILQSLEQLILDAVVDGVIDVPAPLVTRSLVEVSKGYSVYTEAKKLACIPFPFSYIFFGFIVLFSTSVATPFMLAVYCKGVVSTFLFTFGANFLLWYVNLVANTLNNPYQKRARLLDGQSMQHELNLNLIQLSRRSRDPLVKVSLTGEKEGRSSDSLRASNLSYARTSLYSFQQKLRKTATGDRPSVREHSESTRRSAASQVSRPSSAPRASAMSASTPSIAEET